MEELNTHTANYSRAPQPVNLLNVTTTQPPNSTDGHDGDIIVDPAGWERNLVLWVVMAGSLLCLASALISYVLLVWLPRRG